MIGNSHQGFRQNIPRWYSFSVAARLGEIDSFSPRVLFKTDLTEKIQNWRNEGSFFAAAELIGAALLSECELTPDIQSAAEYVQESKAATNVNRQIAVQVLRQVPSFDFSRHATFSLDGFKLRVRVLRDRCHQYPHNPINWLELAHAYTCLNILDKAERCINIAGYLGINNRYIARSIARFYVHIHEPEKALAFLRRNPNLKFDPWLLSADLSIAERFKLKTNSAKIGRNLLASGNIPNFHLSELSSSMGTLEIQHGSIKAAKHYLIQSLAAPSENALAQLEWLLSATKLEIVQFLPKQSLSFEANARSNFRTAKFHNSFDDSVRWLNTQPFSLAPVIMASNASSLGISDQTPSISLLQNAKIFDNERNIVANNLAVALLLNDRIIEAEGVFSRIRESELDEQGKKVNLATKGLLSFRSGLPHDGRALYRKAVSGFLAKSEAGMAAIAAYFWAREEMRFDSTKALQIYEESLKYAISGNRPEIADIASQALKRADDQPALLPKPASSRIASSNY